MVAHQQGYYSEKINRTCNTLPRPACLWRSEWVRGNTADLPHSRRLRYEVKPSTKLALLSVKSSTEKNKTKRRCQTTHTFTHMFDQTTPFFVWRTHIGYDSDGRHNLLRLHLRFRVFAWRRNNAVNDIFTRGEGDLLNETLCHFFRRGKEARMGAVFLFEIAELTAAADRWMGRR